LLSGVDGEITTNNGKYVLIGKIARKKVVEPIIHKNFLRP